MTGTRILVTGASGFIGGHLVRALGPAAFGGGRGTVAADLVNRDVDVVVHAAGRAHVRRDTAQDSLVEYRAVNVDGTRAAAQAAAAAGVRRFILISSVSVYGLQTGRIDRATPIAPVTPYGTSRTESEDAVALIARASGMECVILRLPMVYGEGMKGNPLSLFNAIHRGSPLPLGAIQNERSLIYVGNVVAAVRGLLHAPLGERVSTFLAADAEPVSTPTLVREIAESLGRPSSLWRVPVQVLRTAAAVGTAIAGPRFPLSPHAVQSLSSSLVIDASPLAAAIGATPPFSRREALRLTAAWYLSAQSRSAT